MVGRASGPTRVLVRFRAANPSTKTSNQYLLRRAHTLPGSASVRGSPEAGRQGGIAMPSTKELVLKTANHIEKNPRCYRYTSNRIPLCSDDVGCILGWMAHFSAEH